DDDLSRLEECLYRMETADSEPVFIEADTAFHRVILEGWCNARLSSLIQNLSSGTMRARMWQSIVARGAVEATLASHRSIYNAIVARDADTAASADLMRLAMAEEWLRRVLGQTLEESEPPPVTTT